MCIRDRITRTDLSVFLPPIGGSTAIIFGDMQSIPDASKPLTVRVHDECNGSDVFGSDICTCRPYLLHGIEECVRAAQARRCAARDSHAARKGRETSHVRRTRPHGHTATRARARAHAHARRRSTHPRPRTRTHRARAPAALLACAFCRTHSLSVFFPQTEGRPSLLFCER
eukprot:663330-Pleurochrysis_carterae.AAC.2